jgi:hypothetical protein
MKKISTLLLVAVTLTAYPQIYAEFDFDDGAQGWTSSGIGVDFAWTDEGPAPSTSIWAVPDLLTSTPDGWMMCDDDALGNGIATDTYLTSPILDFSGAPAQLKMEFDQYFQEWETGADTTQVQISSDGGTTWHSVTINDGVGRTDRPNPEHFYINITPGIQDDPSNVIIRFRYRADWSYGWQIDNITITELADYDLVAWNAFTDDVIAEYEYRRVPLGQSQELQAGVVIRNLGALSLTDIEATLEVLDPSSSSLSLTESVANVAEILTFEFDTLWFNTGLTPGEIGLFTFNFSLTAAEPDDAIAVGNEEISQAYEVTDAIYAHIFEEEIDFATSGREQNGVWNEFMVGHVFEIAENTDLVSVEFLLDPQTTPFQEVDVWVYEWVGDEDDGTMIVDEISSYQDIYEIQEADIAGDYYVSIPIGNQVALNAGSTYMIGIHALGGAEQLWVQGRFGDSDYSTVQWGDFNNGGADWWFGWPYSPSVRLTLGTWVESVGENEAQNFSLGQNVPNPASSITAIPVDINVAAPVTLTITDLAGREVYRKAYGTMTTGTQRLEFDVQSLEAGAYTYSVTVGQETLAKTMIVD